MSTPTPTWAETLVQCYREGYSDAEVAAALNITVKEFYKQTAENPSFAKLVEFGRTLSLAFWEGEARKNIRNKTFNTPLYNFYMKNKHGWADKIETTNTNDNTNLNLDELRERVTKKLKEIKTLNTAIDAADAELLKVPVDPKVNDE
jgi:hypothetical protein